MKWDSESWSECGMHDRREFILERRVHIRLRYILHSEYVFFRVHCRVYRSTNVLDPGHEIAESGE